MAEGKEGAQSSDVKGTDARGIGVQGGAPTTGAPMAQDAAAQVIPADNGISRDSSMLSVVRRHQPNWVTEVIEAFGEVTIIVPRERLEEACRFLKATPGLEFNFLADLCGADRGPEEEPRFEVNYHLFSTTKHHRLRLKVLLNEEDTHVPTVTGVWRTANWHERETFDMFGVIFDGHPNLRRILLPEEWQGHALRKDFPLRGYEPYSLT